MIALSFLMVMKNDRNHFNMLANFLFAYFSKSKTKSNVGTIFICFSLKNNISFLPTFKEFSYKILMCGVSATSSDMTFEIQMTTKVLWYILMVHLRQIFRQPKTTTIKIRNIFWYI